MAVAAQMRSTSIDLDKASPRFDQRIVDLVTQVKAAVAQTVQSNFKVTQVDLELKTTTKIGVGGEGKILKLVDISADLSREHVQSITVSLKPTSADRTKGILEIPVDKELLDGFDVVASAVQAASGNGAGTDFELKEATVELDITVDATGKFAVFVGPSGSREQAQKVVLTLAKA